jgi:hypothetical protein
MLSGIAYLSLVTVMLESAQILPDIDTKMSQRALAATLLRRAVEI